MPIPSLFRRRQQHLSEALIQQHLEGSDVEDNAEIDGYELSVTKNPYFGNRLAGCSSEGDLLGCRLWLDQLCEQEQVQLDELLEDSSCREVGLDNERPSKGKDGCNSHHALDSDHSSSEGAILQRIREGRGPRDEVPEDFLATFRDRPLQDNHVQSYGDMRKVLLAWNRRVTEDLEDNKEARVMLSTAIERRSDLLEGSTLSTDKRQALDQSSAEILQALTALRPEIADFVNQKFLDILVMMWANVRIALPDLDDELKLLTMKALINELESKSHESNTVKLSSMARSLSVARLQLDSAEVERLEMKMQAFQKKLRKTVVKKVIDKIKIGRRELAEVKLEELQELTELQAAQKWATHATLGGCQHKQDQTTACDQADGKLQRVLQHQVHELDAHVHVVQSNANALAGMSASLLSRAVEAGLSFEDQHSFIPSERAKVDVEAYVTGGIADIISAREQAANMPNQMEAVEGHLNVLLDAAKSQYLAYDGALRLLEQEESPTTNGSADIELAEKYGPRRESIMLMCRNMQRAM